MSTDQEQITEVMPHEDEPDGDQGMSAGAELCKMLLADPVALLDMFIDVLRRARDITQLPKEQFHAVTIPDVGEASVVTYDSVEKLVAALRAVREQGGQAFGFRGDLLLPSRGGHYLVTPWGRFPLFAEDHDTEVDPRGYLGTIPPIPKAVPVPVATGPANNGDDELSQEADDDFDDEVDDEDVDDEDG